MKRSLFSLLFIIFLGHQLHAQGIINHHDLDKNLWWLEEDTIEREDWLKLQDSKASKFYESHLSLKKNIEDFAMALDSGISVHHMISVDVTEVHFYQSGSEDKIVFQDSVSGFKKEYLAKDFVWGDHRERSRIYNYKVRSDQRYIELLVAPAGNLTQYNWILINLGTFEVEYNFPQVLDFVTWNEQGNFDQFVFWQAVNHEKIQKLHIINFDRNGDGIENSYDSFVQAKYELQLTFLDSLLNTTTFLSSKSPMQVLKATDSKKPNGEIELRTASDLLGIIGDDESKYESTVFVPENKQGAIASIVHASLKSLLAVHYRWGTKRWIDLYDVSESALKIKAEDRKKLNTINLPTCSTLESMEFIDSPKEADKSWLQINVTNCLFTGYTFYFDLESKEYFDISQNPSTFTNIDAFISQYELNGKWYPANIEEYNTTTIDSTEPVPYFMVSSEYGDHERPVLIKFYGGFGLDYLGDGMEKLDNFDKKFILDGGSIVFAGVRGGSEKGLSWYKGGAYENVVNSGLDVVSVAQDLVAKKKTTPQKVAITGTSNGGLTATIALTQSPESFGLVIPVNGVHDLIRADYLDPNNYGFAYEYGTAILPSVLKRFSEYGPLAKAESQNYPTTLVVVGDKDDRVHPAHSYKIYEKLMKNQTGSEAIILNRIKNAGHNPSVDLNPDIRRQYEVTKWAAIYSVFGMSFSTTY